MPLIIPPVFNKNFESELLRELWRKTVSSLSRASEVYFLGFSQAEADIPARFMIRCGFYNQVEGEINPLGGRKTPTGAAKVVVVNPNKNAYERIKDTAGTHSRIEWKKKKVSEWVESL